ASPAAPGRGPVLLFRSSDRATGAVGRASADEILEEPRQGPARFRRTSLPAEQGIAQPTYVGQDLRARRNLPEQAAAVDHRCAMGRIVGDSVKRRNLQQFLEAFLREPVVPCDVAVDERIDATG